MVNNLVSDLSSNGFVSYLDVVRYSGNPDMWKTWSRERAGLKDMEFEAAEICFNECHYADFPLKLCYRIQRSAASLLPPIYCPFSRYCKLFHTMRCQCPQQKGGSECGYFVMRYMYDIVMLSPKDPKIKWKEGLGTRCYTEQQICEIRDLWAEFFTLEYV